LLATICLVLLIGAKCGLPKSKSGIHKLKVMSALKTKKDVLQYLFDGYQENPTAIYDVTVMIKNHEQDPHEFGTYLVDNGWVKNHQYRPQSFVCQISLDGINEIEPEYMESIKQKVISTLGLTGGKESIMEILGYESKHYQKAHDFSKYMEAKGLIKDSLYLPNDVLIELSIESKDYYEQNKAEFIN